MSKKSYQKFKKRILAGAATGVMAGALLFGGSTYAETTDYTAGRAVKTSPMHMMRRWNSDSRIRGLATQLGLDEELVEEGLKSGKTLKQILQENGIDTAELQKAMKEK